MNKTAASIERFANGLDQFAGPIVESCSMKAPTEREGFIWVAVIAFVVFGLSLAVVRDTKRPDYKPWLRRFSMVLEKLYYVFVGLSVIMLAIGFVHGSTETKSCTGGIWRGIETQLIWSILGLIALSVILASLSIAVRLTTLGIRIVSVLLPRFKRLSVQLQHMIIHITILNAVAYAIYFAIEQYNDTQPWTSEIQKGEFAPIIAGLLSVFYIFKVWRSR